MSLSRYLGRMLPALTLAVAAACSDATGPGTVNSIDASTALTQVEPVVTVLDQPALASLEGAGTFFGGTGFGLGPVLSLTNAGIRSGFDARVMRNVVPPTARASTVIPETSRGVTWVYDEVEAAYVQDPDATDAPATGVRIVLYAWDPLSGAPASPLNRIGYVDLTDESTASNDVLRVRLVRDQGTVELANYTISHGVTATSETFGINGSATDGTHTVSFHLNGTTHGEPGAQTVTVTFEVAATGGASVGMQLSFDEASENGTIGVSLAYNGHTLTFDIASTANGAEGEVRYDNKLYATYTSSYTPGTGEHTEQWLKANGDPLTQQEMQQLSALFAHSMVVTVFWAALHWPVYMFGA